MTIGCSYGHFAVRHQVLYRRSALDNSREVHRLVAGLRKDVGGRKREVRRKVRHEVEPDDHRDKPHDERLGQANAGFLQVAMP